MARNASVEEVLLHIQAQSTDQQCDLLDLTKWLHDVRVRVRVRVRVCVHGVLVRVCVCVCVHVRVRMRVRVNDTRL